MAIELIAGDGGMFDVAVTGNGFTVRVMYLIVVRV